jgi:hypothetical protein
LFQRKDGGTTFRINLGVAGLSGWLEKRAMAEDDKEKQIVISTAEAASGAESGNTLLPMLIGSLIMIIIGAIVLMMFV